LVFAALSLVSLAQGCGSHSPTTSDAIVAALALPAGWQPEPRSEAIVVPGDALAGWTGPEGARLVVYRTLYVPQATARSLANELATRLVNDPGVTLLQNETRRVGSHDVGCVSVEVSPPGGDSPGRRRDWVCLARDDGTYWLRWDYPASARGRFEAEIDRHIESLAQLAPASAASPSPAY
jgi:hypothetical protein